MAHPGTAGASQRWLLTRSAAESDQLPGALLIPDGRQWLSVTRVIFLVPDAPVHIDRVIQALEALGLPHKTPIILADLAGPDNRGSSKQRRFDMLVARVRQVFPAASGRRLYNLNWLEAMHEIAGRNDLLIAAAGQHLPQDLFAEQSLSQTLLHELNLPVLEIVGIFLPWRSRLLGWIRRGLFNLFPFLVVGGFFWVQTQIGRQAQGWVSTFALGATVVVEFAIIFFWSLFLD